jgi:hypothetical protein
MVDGMQHDELVLDQSGGGFPDCLSVGGTAAPAKDLQAATLNRTQRSLSDEW